MSIPEALLLAMAVLAVSLNLLVLCSTLRLLLLAGPWAVRRARETGRRAYGVAGALGHPGASGGIPVTPGMQVLEVVVVSAEGAAEAWLDAAEAHGPGDEAAGSDG
jgi:hypothetical protein